MPFLLPFFCNSPNEEATMCKTHRLLLGWDPFWPFRGAIQPGCEKVRKQPRNAARPPGQKKAEKTFFYQKKKVFFCFFLLFSRGGRVSAEMGPKTEKQKKNRKPRKNVDKNTEKEKKTEKQKKKRKNRKKKKKQGREKFLPLGRRS